METRGTDSWNWPEGSCLWHSRASCQQHQMPNHCGLQRVIMCRLIESGARVVLPAVHEDDAVCAGQIEAQGGRLDAAQQDTDLHHHFTSSANGDTFLTHIHLPASSYHLNDKRSLTHIVNLCPCFPTSANDGTVYHALLLHTVWAALAAICSDEYLSNGCCL